MTTPAVTQPGANNWLTQQDTGKQAPAEKPTAYSYAAVKLHYLESSPILVRGPQTGRQYEFSGAQPVQLVDVRDAEALLQTRFFRRAY